jgi:hypothetical protein
VATGGVLNRKFQKEKLKTLTEIKVEIQEF